LAAPVLDKLSWPPTVAVVENDAAPVTDNVPVADSVVNAPVLGVVLPMGGGDAKDSASKGMEMLSTV
jgi:hypothetical protein